MSSNLSNSNRREMLATTAAVGGAALFVSPGFVDTALAGGVSSTLRPISVHFPDADLADLRRRVVATRWPEKETVNDTTQGVRLATMQALAQYWANDYDWRRCEAQLNALPQFVTEIDGLDIHFIHVRSKHANALPVIITHGWPGSIIEQLKVIAPLTDPTAHGGTAAEAFDVVIPSLPGHGFSGKPTATGWDPTADRARLERADAAPGLHALHRPGRRLGQRGHRADGAANAAGPDRHPHQHAGDPAAQRFPQRAAPAVRRRWD